MPRTLIIGATGGIGKQVTAALAARGDIVVPYGRNLTALYRSAVTGPHQVYPETPDSIDYIVFLQRNRETENSWMHEINVSLDLTRKVVELMLPRFAGTGDKAIVITSSINARLVNERLPIGYHMAKAALEAMCRYWAVLLGPKGIRVNCVAPGTVHKDGPEWPNAEFHKSITPLRRMGEASEIASVIAFLCSPAASWITGQTITVDGGVSLQWQESLANGLLQENSVPAVRERTAS